jgi:antitoxin (DNA-binding transcriptional repressor) of toxin-antitoxin stability system
MKIVNTHEAKTSLSALLAEIENQGQQVRICRNGKPIADLVPCKRRNRLLPHPVMSKFTFDYDPTETLAEDEWPEHER